MSGSHGNYPGVSRLRGTGAWPPKQPVRGFGIAEPVGTGPWPAMSTRTANVIDSTGVRSIQELARMSDRQLLRIKNCGRATVAEIRSMTSHLRDPPIISTYVAYAVEMRIAREGGTPEQALGALLELGSRCYLGEK